MTYTVRIRFLEESSNGRTIVPRDVYLSTAKVSDGSKTWSIKLEMTHFFGSRGFYDLSRYGMGKITFLVDDPDNRVTLDNLVSIYEGSKLVAVAQKWPK